MKTVYWVALVLASIGAINWGLIGLFEFNLVAAVFGAGSAVSRAVYIIVGLAGLALIATSATTAPRHTSLPEVVRTR